MDNDKAIGIQRLNYTDDPLSGITDYVRQFQFRMWAADFNEVSPPNETLQITSTAQMARVLHNQNIEHQVFLRAAVKDDPLITDEYDCVFLQARFSISTG